MHRLQQHSPCWRKGQKDLKDNVAMRIIAPALLVLVLLTSCGGQPLDQNGTPTLSPRPTATTGLTPTTTPGPTATPTATPTPMPTSIPTPTPTPQPSACDTPPGVQPVSSAEIDIGDSSRPRIALTFDAGGPSTPTSSILDILAKHQVHSTFFITGDWANLYPDLVHRIHTDGHEIGNHTMHHNDLRTLSDVGVCTELNQANQVISGVTGVTTRPY